MPKTIALGLTHPGTVRNRNEDAFFLVDKVVPGLAAGQNGQSAHTESPVQFFAIADGMGGRGIGDVAAMTALAELDTACRQIRQSARFDFQTFTHHYLQRAGQAVVKALQSGSGLYAGTSLTLLCLTEETACVLSLGNCRCYRLRDGHLDQLTVDDLQTDVHPRRLSRYLGQLPEERPAEPAQLYQYALQKEDVFLLTTDGFTDQVGDDRIAAQLQAPVVFAAKPAELMRLALAGEARDNVTLLLLRVLDPGSTKTTPAAAARPVRHRQYGHRLLNSLILRAVLILLACVLTGFVAGWLILTVFF